MASIVRGEGPEKVRRRGGRAKAGESDVDRKSRYGRGPFVVMG